MTALPPWPDTRQLEAAMTETEYRKALEDYVASGLLVISEKTFFILTFLLLNIFSDSYLGGDAKI